MGFGYGYGRTTSHNGKTATAKDGGRAKSVFSNDMVAHVWAQQVQSFGRSGNGNFYFEDETIFSYGRHFPIARFVAPNIVLFTSQKNSVTTAGHISDVWRALRGLPVTVVMVPDLKAWNEARPQSWELESDDYRAKALERFEKANAEVVKAYARRIGANFEHGDRDAIEAFRKLFKVRARLPKDCAKWAADERAAIEKAAFDAKVDRARKGAKALDGRNPIASTLAAEYIAPTDKADLYCVADALRVLEQRKAQANQSRYWLNKGKASADLRGRVSKLIKQLKESVAAWESYRAQRQAAEALERARAFAESIRNGTFNNVMARGIIEDAKSGKAWKWHDSMTTFRAPHELRDTLETLRNAGDETTDLESWCNRMASIAFAVDAVERQRGRTPDCFLPRYGRSNDRRTPEERRAAWLSGANVPGFHQESPTLVRRKGDRLETSRGADAPFSHAVAIFVKAQACRAAGKDWHRNGETMRAGHFQLESIDTAGNIRVGCHSIAFEEMQRLAMAEAPAAIRANYPVPAVIA